ncbi:UNVERIFIED_CONTAM: hypothetical protein Sradi_0989600 [Sesamum radiatum]|uniref:Uncharacterized protein n=1 Tax=Sesamum radiatum TaxID=300843 RepID=A0AAW2V6I9_SESRA
MPYDIWRIGCNSLSSPASHFKEWVWGGCGRTKINDNRLLYKLNFLMIQMNQRTLLQLITSSERRYLTFRVAQPLDDSDEQRTKTPHSVGKAKQESPTSRSGSISWKELLHLQTATSPGNGGRRRQESNSGDRYAGFSGRVHEADEGVRRVGMFQDREFPGGSPRIADAGNEGGDGVAAGAADGDQDEKSGCDRREWVYGAFPDKPALRGVGAV